MKLSFTGDLSFRNIERFTTDPFKYINQKLSKLNCVINLESVFLPNDYAKDPIKNKICLRQNNDTSFFLKKLNPLLINLANNHMNDYGNLGIENTNQILRANKINSFGVGKVNEDHNLFVLDEEKILFLSYVTRDCDLSGSILFNESNFMGPKDFSFQLYKQQTKGFDDYIKIVLFHWGIEQKHYPLPQQRVIAKKLINSGADLIIGNHAHVMQSYEKYKNKWIFYSLGNFLFPDFSLKTKDKTYSSKAIQKNKVSLLPIFNIENKKITLEQLYYTKVNEQFEIILNNKCINYNLFLFSNEKIYEMFYIFYDFCYYFIPKLGYPYRKLKKILQLLKKRYNHD